MIFICQLIRKRQQSATRPVPGKYSIIQTRHLISTAIFHSLFSYPGSSQNNPPSLVISHSRRKTGKINLCFLCCIYRLLFCNHSSKLTGILYPVDNRRISSQCLCQFYLFCSLIILPGT